MGNKKNELPIQLGRTSSNDMALSRIALTQTIFRRVGGASASASY